MSKGPRMKMDGGQIFRQIKLYGILVAAVGSMTFFGVCSPTGSQLSGPSGAAAIVDGEEISSLDFRRSYQQESERQQQQSQEPFDPAAIQLSRNVLARLVNQRILAQEAQRSGFMVLDSAVDEILSEAEVFKKDGRFSGELFSNFLRNQAHSEKTFSEEIKRSLVLDRMRAFAMDSMIRPSKAAELDYRLRETKLNIEFLKIGPSQIKTNVSAEEIKKFLAGEGSQEAKNYYESNKSKFQSAKQVKARHLLVAFQGARNATGEAAKRSEEAARKKAEALRVKAVAKPSSFVQLVKANTDEPSGKEKGGDLGYFTKEAMVKEFSDAAFKLKSGKISEVVKSPFGFHIIKAEGIQPEKMVTLEAASQEIAKTLLENQKKPEKVKQLASEILTVVKSTKSTEKILKKNELQWQKTGEFSLDKGYIKGLGSETDLKKAAFSLRKPKQVYPDAIKVKNDYYILRLTARKDADLKKLSSKEKEQLGKGGGYMESFQIYTALTSSVAESYVKDGKVIESEDFKNYDMREQAQ